MDSVTVTVSHIVIKFDHGLQWLVHSSFNSLVNSLKILKYVHFCMSWQKGRYAIHAIIDICIIWKWGRYRNYTNLYSLIHYSDHVNAPNHRHMILSKSFCTAPIERPDKQEIQKSIYIYIGQVEFPYIFVKQSIFFSD